MGLTLGVGWLAEHAAQERAEDFSLAREPYEQLNAVLAEAGMDPHHEPVDIPDHRIWSSDMWGYGGLHAVRRLAAYAVLRGTTPPPTSYENLATDPVTELYYAHLSKWYAASKATGIRALFTTRVIKPRFQHLAWHSDAEGFYIPRDFEDVILDYAQPQRDGLGGMVGSTQRLLLECQELAGIISLPLDLDEEDNDLLEAAEAPSAEYSDWRRFGIEAFGIIRLVRGCERSLELNAALVFG